MQDEIPALVGEGNLYLKCAYNNKCVIVCMYVCVI